MVVPIREDRGWRILRQRAAEAYKEPIDSSRGGEDEEDRWDARFGCLEQNVA